jgi:hypothetical protein
MMAGSTMGDPSYAAILRDSERARFSLDEASAGLVHLDFDKPFLPEALVHAARLPFLSAPERVLVSQVRAYGYLGLATLAEKLILPFVMSQAAQWLHGDCERFLALMSHGQRAAKHIALFERFSTALQRGFDAAFAVFGPVEDVTARLLTNDTLAVGLLVLHFECLTQTHYVRGARACTEMDAQFKELLRLHWREEAPNAQLCALSLGELADRSSQHERARAVQQYARLLDELAVVCRGQLELDLLAFERIARSLSDTERQTWRQEQATSYEEVFVRSGRAHPLFQSTVAQHFTSA